MSTDATIELRLDGTWTDITGDVRQVGGGIRIDRGRRNEGARTDPGKTRLSINNAGGKYSPRNPESSLYGQIGRNTPLRVRQGTSSVTLSLSGTSGSYVSTPDSAALDITGDLDVRLEMEPPSWHLSSVASELAGKWSGNDGDSGGLSWILIIEPDGRPDLHWTSDGTFDTRSTAAATTGIAADAGRLAVRATLDVDDGTGTSVVTFYTAPDITGPWTQLGSTVTATGTTSIAATDTPVSIGSAAGDGDGFNNTTASRGTVHAFQLYDGIDGTAVADMAPSGQAGDRSFTDSTGLTWTLSGAANLRDPSILMAGEVAQWPPRWDVTGSDVYTPIESAGVLRRLGNINSPLRSPLYRGTVDSGPIAYWPMEDGEDSSSLASGLDSGSPMSIVRTPTLADDDGFVASEPVPTMQTGQLVGTVPAYTATGSNQLQMMMHVPESGVSSTAQFLELRLTGSVRRVEVLVQPDGDAQIIIRDAAGAELTNTTIGFGFNGPRRRIEVQINEQGSDVEWRLGALEEGADNVGFVSDTITGQTAGTVTQVTLGSPSLDLGDTAIGHVSVRDEITGLFSLTHESNAWQGESAARRIARLCAEQGIPLAITGDPLASAAMGPQESDTLLSLLRECAEADMGMLGEMPDVVGLQYRTHESLYNRPPALTLQYDGGDLSPPLEPTEDDRALANDVTARRRDGSSARAVKASGPLSVQPPPDGVGRYDSSVTLSLHSDDQVTQQAAWRLHLGTLDELRYPRATVNLARNTALRDAIKALDQGDRVVITGLPDWLPPGDADLTVEGWRHELDGFQWTWTANASPARSHDVFELGSDTLGRLATDGSELANTVDSTQTSIDVSITDGPLWTTDSADLPLDIEVGGERMTVTAISGSSSPQTFTVTRSVDGVVKSHSSGDAVQLHHPGVLAIGQSGEDL